MSEPKIGQLLGQANSNEYLASLTEAGVAARKPGSLEIVRKKTGSKLKDMVKAKRVQRKTVRVEKIRIKKEKAKLEKERLKNGGRLGNTNK